MCGIAGYLGLREIPETRLLGCVELMRRRGPNHSAYRHWLTPAQKNLYFLHSRLSIIDLDGRANQPFNYGANWLIVNGELYNYLEVKKDLQTRGHTFNTESDTEVLLHAVSEFGVDGLDRCEGMWAFAVYDEQKGSLVLARDRFGEKPLFLYRDGSGLYFASEVKFIVALLGRKLEVNTNHLFRYLVNGYKSLYKQEEQFFRGLDELRPASALSISADGKECISPYWKLEFRPDDQMSYAEAVTGVRDRLITAVELRLRADVPAAFCMSGGVDSNSLISVARKILNYDVHGFTITNSDARYEEQEMVDCAVQELGIRHTSIPAQVDGFTAKLRILIRQHDAPVYTSNYYAHWLLMESIAHEGYRISLSGTAADELFTGYYDHHLAYFYDVRNDQEILNAAKDAWEKYVRPMVRNPFLKDPNLFIRQRDFRGHIYFDAEGFSQYLLHDWHEPFREVEFTRSLLRNRTMNELFHEAIPVILHEDDLNAMYYSIENRSPFLDRRLAEFCHRIPTKHLIRNGYAKAVLRDAMRGIVPSAILENRRKVGFNAPIYSLLNVRDSQVRSYLLNDSPIFDYLKREKIEKLIEKVDLPNSESKFLFYFLNSKIFLEEFAS
jgi:asparagine synthase (glutamine-hydrolysing)